MDLSPDSRGSTIQNGPVAKKGLWNRMKSSAAPMHASGEEEDISSSFRVQRNSYTRTLHQIVQIQNDSANIRRLSYELVMALKSLKDSTANAMAERGVSAMIGPEIFDQLSDSQNLLLAAMHNNVMDNFDLIAEEMRVRVDPSTEQSSIKLRNMTETMESRAALAKEADYLSRPAKSDQSLKAMQAAAAHRLAARDFAKAELSAVLAMRSTENDFRDAMYASLVKVSQAVHTQTKAMAESFVAAGALISSISADPQVSKYVSDAVNMSLPDDISSSLSSDIFPQQHAALTEVDTDGVTFLKNLSIPLLEGEEVILRVSDVKDEYAGQFGLLVATNYRIRFVSANLHSEFVAENSYSSPSGSLESILNNDSTVCAIPVISRPSHHVDSQYPVGSVIYSSPKVIAIPLMSISRLEVVSGSSSIVLNTTDMRVFGFHFGVASIQAESFAKTMMNRIFNGGGVKTPECTLALAAKRAPSTGPEGWNIYTPEFEFERLLESSRSVGLLSESSPPPFVISPTNHTYQLCSTYPSSLLLPASMPEGLVAAAAKFRSKGRLPAVSWFRGSLCIARSSQPLTGVFNARCAEDERLLSALVSDHGRVRSRPPVWASGASNSPASLAAAAASASLASRGPHLAIYDARPRLNAIGNAAKGGGAEAMGNYPFATFEYLNIDNIHVVREALLDLRARILRVQRIKLQRTLEAVFCDAPAAATAPNMNMDIKDISSNSSVKAVEKGGNSQSGLNRLSMMAVAAIVLPNADKLVAAQGPSAEEADGLLARARAADDEDDVNTATEVARGSRMERVLAAARPSLAESIVDAYDDPTAIGDNLGDATLMSNSPVHPVLSPTSTTTIDVTSSVSVSGIQSPVKSLGATLDAAMSPLASSHAIADDWNSPASSSVGNRKNHSSTYLASPASKGASSSMSMKNITPSLSVIARTKMLLRRIGRNRDRADPSVLHTRRTSASEFTVETPVRRKSFIWRREKMSSSESAEQMEPQSLALSEASGNDISRVIWLKLLAVLLDGSVRMSLRVLAGNSVLVHCSDGWDRTSCLSALCQLIIDPYYRTLDGFCQLVEKEWSSFGHRFSRRCGTGGTSHDRADFTDGQRSPIFLQFLDCVFQVVSQFPSSFQFSEVLLAFLADHAYSARFGTFLFDCDKDRKAALLKSSGTKEDPNAFGITSAWTYVLAAENKERFINFEFVAPDCEPGELVPIIPNSSENAMVIWPYWGAKWGY